mmetsp:Transcript_57170/g.135783  ORF Transcript_57170/g.135783 Transcript_57170/m.135783 type:complete len:233 (+) Transcript_57170:372-1070(+)
MANVPYVYAAASSPKRCTDAPSTAGPRNAPRLCDAKASCCSAGERASPCPTESTNRRNAPVYTTEEEHPRSITGTTSMASDSGENSARNATPLAASPAPTITLRLIFSETSAATLATKMKAMAAIISSPPSADAVVAKATFRCSGRITSENATVEDTRTSDARERAVWGSFTWGARGSILVNSASLSRRCITTAAKQPASASAASKHGMNAPSEESEPPMSGPIVRPKPPQK